MVMKVLCIFVTEKKETENLLSALKNGRNITLVSPRRMGKTGLIWHTFHHIFWKPPGWFWPADFPWPLCRIWRLHLVHTNHVEPLVRTFPECQQTGTVGECPFCRGGKQIGILWKPDAVPDRESVLPVACHCQRGAGVTADGEKVCGQISPALRQQHSCRIEGVGGKGTDIQTKGWLYCIWPLPEPLAETVVISSLHSFPYASALLGCVNVLKQIFLCFV